MSTKAQQAEVMAKAVKLLEALIEPHSKLKHPHDDHEWRKCRRCLAQTELVRAPKATAEMLSAVLAALRGVPSLIDEDRGGVWQPIAAFQPREDRQPVLVLSSGSPYIMDALIEPDGSLLWEMDGDFFEPTHFAPFPTLPIDSGTDSASEASTPHAQERSAPMTRDDLIGAQQELRRLRDLLELLNGDDYLAFAGRHVRAALLKRDDAPCSSAQHERQAKLALQWERVPTIAEGLDWASDSPRDPEKWPCTFSHHDHATRADAVECARRRTAPRARDQRQGEKRTMEFFATKFTGMGFGRAGECRVVVRTEKKAFKHQFIQIIDDDGAGVGFTPREIPALIIALQKALDSLADPSLPPAEKETP